MKVKIGLLRDLVILGGIVRAVTVFMFVLFCTVIPSGITVGMITMAVTIDLICACTIKKFNLLEGKQSHCMFEGDCLVMVLGEFLIYDGCQIMPCVLCLLSAVISFCFCEDSRTLLSCTIEVVACILVCACLCEMQPVGLIHLLTVLSSLKIFLSLFSSMCSILRGEWA